MAEVKYINKSVRTYDDEKIKIIESMPEADSLLVIWDKLICLAGKINAWGWIYLSEDRPFTDEMLATVLNRPINTVRLALNAFKELGMVKSNDSGIFLNNFTKWQNIDALERIRNNTRKRVAKYRQQKILKESNVTDTLRNAIEGEGEEEENKNKILKEEKGVQGGNPHPLQMLLRKKVMKS